MISTSSLAYELAIREAYYSGKTIKVVPMTARTVTREPENGFRADYSDDIAPGVTAATVTISSEIDDVADPPRVETTFTDGELTVPGGTDDLLDVLYYVDTGNAATDLVIHIGPLEPPVVIAAGGNTVIIRAGDDGVCHARLIATDHS